MASAPTKLSPVTLDDFERMEAEAPEDERWELVRGRFVRAMVGARWEHNRIIHNIGYELRRRFEERGSPCRIFQETFRLRSETEQSSLLPDVIVNREPLAPGATSLQRPVVLVEVLSTHSSTRDRDEKREVFMALSSLRHYVMVAGDKAQVETLDHHDGFGTARIADGLDADLLLPAIDVTLSLASIYRDVLG